MSETKLQKNNQANYANYTNTVKVAIIVHVYELIFTQFFKDQRFLTDTNVIGKLYSKQRYKTNVLNK